MPDNQASLLSRRLLMTMLTPVTLLLIAGALLAMQIQRLDDNTRWVDHSGEVIRSTYETLKGIVDQETALRGYLLTEDPAFLAPYRNASPDRSIEELTQLTVDNPEQQRRARDLARNYGEWVQLVRVVVEGGDLAEGRSHSGMVERKQRMDHIRELSKELLETERSLRVVRAEELVFTRNVMHVGMVVLLTICALLIAFVARRQLGSVAATYDAALAGERDLRASLEDEGWVRSQQVELSATMQGDISVAELCKRALQKLVQVCGADIAAIYVSEGSRLRRVSAHALGEGEGTEEVVALGQGLLGQAAADNRFGHVEKLPDNYLVVRSGTGRAGPSQLLLVPASIEERVYAMVELGFLSSPGRRAVELCKRIGEALAGAIRSAEYKANLREYLEETQRQAEELAAQQEELRVANEELAEQSNALREAQGKMELQHAELEQTNESLARQATLLEHHNEELTRAQTDLAQKAAEVARANQYKSEFLANMSHELRTPLNSTLILAKLLADNKEQNLSEEQIKFAETIYQAGNDLLVLINDVLDLSRIEAGKMEVHPTSMPIGRLLEPTLRTFEPVARQKGVALNVQIDHHGVVETDAQRVQQIVRNLLSNAFKFTERGEVALTVHMTDEDVEIAVRDSGIGIAPENQTVIFEAFRQADGTTNRRFGGTGLGLSISRDLAQLLGGTLTVQSELGKGSTFTLKLPRKLNIGASHVVTVSRTAPQVTAGSERDLPVARVPSSKMAPVASNDDRNQLVSGRRVLLIVEDDTAFADVLVGLGHEQELQCLVADSADEGVRLAQKHLPNAIILDIGLPDHSGLSVLDRLKRNPATRHIPVHVISGRDEAQRALSMGAVGYALKPVSRDELVRAVAALRDRFAREQRLVLVVEDDVVQRESVAKLLAGPGVEIVAVEAVAEALAQLKQRTYDCIVTDLTFPTASGYDLLETLANDDCYSFPPVIVYTGRTLTDEEEQRLRRYSSSIIVKGARSPERLLDEVTLFLHQVESTMPPDRQRMLRAARDREAVFEGRTILLVEDDVRNVFALVSLLEPKGAKVEIARNGIEAIDKLQKVPNIALVLMDVMMPEMDGLTATREIRKRREWQKLPIIALTAKAMRDDQEKCLAAGANDYVAKPFDVEMLLSLLRVWLSR